MHGNPAKAQGPSYAGREAATNEQVPRAPWLIQTLFGLVYQRPTTV